MIEAPSPAHRSAPCSHRRKRTVRCSRLLLLALGSAGFAFPLAAFADPPTDRDRGEAHGAPPVMTLEQLTRAAERRYPGVSAASARVRAAEEQLGEAWVSPFFQSNVTAVASVVPELRGTSILSDDPQVPLDNPWQPAVGVNVEGVIPLFTFGKLPAARDAARAGIRAAEGDRDRVRAQLRYDVRRAYFALQLSLDIKQMLSEGIPALRSAAEHLETQISDGDPDVDPLDRYRLASAVAEIEAREADADRLEETARAALRVLTGVRRFQIPECPIEPTEYELESRQSYVRRAHDRRPETRMLEAAVSAREAGVHFAEAGFFPDIGLAYRLGVTYAPGITDQTNPFIIDQANYSTVQAGLVMRWSLDLWGNTHRVHRQMALLDDARLRSREAHIGMEVEVVEAYEAARAASRQVDSWGRGRLASRRWFIAASQGRDVGAAEPRDLVDAARAYFTARYGHLQAIHDHNAALANLERASGEQLVEHWQPPCE